MVIFAAETEEGGKTRDLGLELSCERSVFHAITYSASG